MKPNFGMTDKLLIFEEIFHRHYSSLINYACKYVLRKSVAEDVLQEVFMSMWINKEIIDFETKNIEPYLYKAVRNRCLNYLKFVKTHTPLDEKDIDFLIQREVFVTPDESLSLEDLERELQQCIESLTPQCKKVFIYSRYHNLKNREIAIMLDISEKAVEKHITKALTEIRGDLIKKNLLPLLFLFFGN